MLINEKHRKRQLEKITKEINGSLKRERDLGKFKYGRKIREKAKEITKKWKLGHGERFKYNELHIS